MSIDCKDNSVTKYVSDARLLNTVREASLIYFLIIFQLTKTHLNHRIINLAHFTIQNTCKNTFRIAFTNETSYAKQNYGCEIIDTFRLKTDHRIKSTVCHVFKILCLLWMCCLNCMSLDSI